MVSGPTYCTQTEHARKLTPLIVAKMDLLRFYVIKFFRAVLGPGKLILMLEMHKAYKNRHAKESLVIAFEAEFKKNNVRLFFKHYLDSWCQQYLIDGSLNK